MKSHDPIRSERRLLEALRAAETATLALRDYAATVLLPGPPAAGGPSIGEAAPARVELLEGGWLAITLEAVLPHRGDGDRGRFLAHSLRAAIRQAFPDRLPPKFHICVLAYEHIYGPGRRFLAGKPVSPRGPAADFQRRWDLYGFEAVRQRQSVGQSLCRTDPAGNGGSLGKELSVKRAAGCRDRSA